MNVIYYIKKGEEWRGKTNDKYTINNNNILSFNHNIK